MYVKRVIGNLYRDIEIKFLRTLQYTQCVISDLGPKNKCIDIETHIYYFLKLLLYLFNSHLSTV